MSNEFKYEILDLEGNQVDIIQYKKDLKKYCEDLWDGVYKVSEGANRFMAGFDGSVEVSKSEGRTIANLTLEGQHLYFLEEAAKIKNKYKLSKLEE